MFNVYEKYYIDNSTTDNSLQKYTFDCTNLSHHIRFMIDGTPYTMLKISCNIFLHNLRNLHFLKFEPIPMV